MSRGVFQPVGQKRLTNIAVVRLKKNGERFEIACYKNKVGDWRSGIEKDLDEVLQTTSVFHNVGKGIVAKEKELKEAFGMTDQETICKEILAKGELQVSDKERKQDFDNLFKDVAGILAEKCVNPATQRPYTLSMLERALRDIHFNPDPKKSAKQQALETIPLLQSQFPIERARMKLKLSVPLEHQQELEQQLQQYEADVQSMEATGHTCTIIAQVEPGAFRDLHAFMQNTTKGAGRLEMLSLAVMAEGATADEFAALGAAAAAAAASTAVAAAPLAPAAVRSSSPNSLAASSSGQHQGLPVVAAGRSAPMAEPAARRGAGDRDAAGSSGGEVVYARGPISGLPEAHASRRERFAELDALQEGWTLELRTKGDTIEAVFFHPAGEKVGAYANARRMALQASKAR